MLLFTPCLAGGVQSTAWRCNEANRELFPGVPERFETCSGGWGVLAMSESEKVGLDPKSFLIEDGGQLLRYDRWLADTGKQWLEQGGAQARAKADEQWTKLIQNQTGAARAMEAK